MNSTRIGARNAISHVNASSSPVARAVAQKSPRKTDKFERTSAPAIPSLPADKDAAKAGDQKLSALQVKNVEQALAQIKERQSRIENLAKSISSDSEVQVRPGTAWAYNFESNVVTYPAIEMLKRPIDEVFGLILHEIGHRRFTKWTPLENIPGVGNDPFMVKAFHRLWNALEDPRVNNLMISSYGGAKKYMRALYETEFLSDVQLDDKMNAAIAKMREQHPELEKTPDEELRAKLGQPRSEQFALGAIHRWASECFRGRVIPCPFLKDPEVKKALEHPAVREAIEQAITPWREIGLHPLSETEIQAQSDALFNIVRDQLWPIYKQLLEQDRKDGKDDELMQDMNEANTDPPEQSGGGGGGGGSSKSAGKSQGDKGDQGEQGQSGKGGKSGKGKKSQGAGKGEKSDASDEAGESGKEDASGKADKADKAQKDKAGGKQDAAEGADKADGAKGDDKADGADGAKGADKADGADGAENADGTGDAYEAIEKALKELAKSQSKKGKGKSASADKADETDDAEGAGGKSTDAANDKKAKGAGEADNDDAEGDDDTGAGDAKADKADGADDADDADATDRADGADKADGADGQSAAQDAGDAGDAGDSNGDGDGASSSDADSDSTSVSKSTQKSNGRGKGTSVTLDDLSNGDLQEELRNSAKQVDELRRHGQQSMRNDYERRRNRLSRPIDTLQGHVATAYVKDAMPTWDPLPVRNGQRWNLDLAMQSRYQHRATGVYDDRVTNKRTVPTAHSVEITFVVDCSSSMNDAMDKVKDALVECMEAAVLEKIKVNLVLFHNDAQAYEFDLESEDHQTAMELIDQFGRGSTNDVAGLQKAMDVLEKSDANRKVVIVITDGEGQGQAMRDLVEQASDRNGLDLDIYGVGLGEGMAAVEKVYPTPVKVETADELGEKLGQIMIDITTKRQDER